MLKTNTAHNNNNNTNSSRSRSHNYTNTNRYNDDNNISNIMNGDNARNNNIIITTISFENNRTHDLNHKSL